MQLPSPRTSGQVSLEAALQKRHSVREFADAPLSLEDLGQLLWAAQGENRSSGYRTAPSAGALYPLFVYLVAGRVTSLPAGVHRYQPHGHALVPGEQGDLRRELSVAALAQDCLAEAPAVICLAAVMECTTSKYGERGGRYVHAEVGHAAQNVCLQAVALGLGTTMIGAFNDDAVKVVLGMNHSALPLGLLPVGRPA